MIGRERDSVAEGENWRKNKRFLIVKAIVR